MRSKRYPAAFLLAVCCPVGVASAAPPTCTVPGSHWAIQDAVLDSTCTTIDLVARDYPESVRVERTVTIRGPAEGYAVIEGLVMAAGPGTRLTLRDVQVNNSCSPAALSASDGAGIVGQNLIVNRVAGLPCPPVLQSQPIFLDDFESGNTSAWSITVD